MSKVWGRRLGLALSAVLCVGGRAQTISAVGSAPASVSEVLLAMQTRAAVVFAGQVVSIDRHDAAGYVDVRFRVEEPVRGCSRLGAYVLREWAGRWMGHAPRYRVGERRLMMLTARGPSGMSAPVFGDDGAIPLARTIAGPIANAQGVTPDTGTEMTSLSVDLRLLQARVARTVVASAPQRYGSDAAIAGQGGDTAWVGVVAPIEVAPQNTEAPLSAVLSLLRGGSGGTLGVGYAAR